MVRSRQQCVRQQQNEAPTRKKPIDFRELKAADNKQTKWTTWNKKCKKFAPRYKTSSDCDALCHNHVDDLMLLPTLSTPSRILMSEWVVFFQKQTGGCEALNANALGKRESNGSRAAVETR